MTQTQALLQIKSMQAEDPEGFVLNCDSLSLKPGQIHALVGTGGAGKESFIKALAGLIDVKGEMLYQGTKVPYDIHALRHMKVDFVFHRPALVDTMTVAENMSLNRYPAKRIPLLINWFKIATETRETLRQAGMSVEPRTLVKNLTTDEKKMLSIAKVLINKPRVLLMHEPFVGLSVNSKRNLYRIIEELKAAGGSVLYITKHWEEALKVADELSVMFRGRIVGTLSSDEAKTNPRRLITMLLGDEGNSSSSIEDDRRLFNLDSVFRAAEFLTSKYELKDVLKLLAKHTSEVMKAEGCVIKLVDLNTHSTIERVSYLKPGANSVAQLKPEAVMEICQNNDIFYSTERDKEFSNLFEKHLGVKTVICTPVALRSQITGFIQVMFDKVYTYSNLESFYLSALAREAAIAIEDTRLMGRSSLLQESHHRIKNNLQSIVSLITLQKDYVHENSDKSLQDVFNTIILRVKSIAAVHDLLSKEGFGRSIINVKDIVDIVVNFHKSDTKIEMRLDLDDIFVAYDKASAIALIINELLSNCMEHAFAPGDQGLVQLSCKQREGNLELKVIDNGRGLPPDFVLDGCNRLGLTIVRSIVVNQFYGKFRINSREPGTSVQIIVPQ